jgi:hypothetical protein
VPALLKAGLLVLRQLERALFMPVIPIHRQHILRMAYKMVAFLFYQRAKAKAKFAATNPF